MCVGLKGDCLVSSVVGVRVDGAGARKVEGSTVKDYSGILLSPPPLFPIKEALKTTARSVKRLTARA